MSEEIRNENKLNDQIVAIYLKWKFYSDVVINTKHVNSLGFTFSMVMVQVNIK